MTTDPGGGGAGSVVEPQEPGGGEAQIIASWDGATAWLMVQPTPKSRTVLKRPEIVGVSVVLVEATPEQSDRILSSVSDSVMVVAEGFQPDDGTHDDVTCSESGLLRDAGGVLHVCTDFVGGGRCGDNPGLFIAEDVNIRVMLPTVAGAASLANFAEVVAADITSLADAAMVTMEVAVSADAGGASLADASILFPAHPAGVVTKGVAPLADAGPVTMAVADLADAGILFPADHAGTITVEVACLVDAEEVTVGVTDLADAGMAFLADPAGTVTVGVASLADAELVTTGVTNGVDVTLKNDKNS